MTTSAGDPGARVLLINDHPSGGIGRYVRHLHRELVRLRDRRPAVDLLLQNVPRHAALTDWVGEGAVADGWALDVQRRPAWAKQRGFGKLYQLTSYYYFPRRIPPGYALYHVASQMMGGSTRCVRPVVATCHDAVALRMPGNQAWFAGRMRLRHLRALTRAEALIFISEYSRRDFLGAFAYPEDRTAVVHHGVSDVFAPADRAASRERLGLPPGRPLILHVGTEERRKNVETLLHALRILADRAPQVLLLRVGGESARARRLIARLRLEAHVRYVPDVPDTQLATLYTAADVFVFPSLYEGFGLPALEALKSGCPVVAANSTAIPEVTGDAAVLVEPMDAEGFAAATQRVLEDRVFRETLVRRGVARTAAFTWARAARRTADVYERLLGR